MFEIILTCIWLGTLCFEVIKQILICGVIKIATLKRLFF